MVLKALAGVGGVDYLMGQARENPQPFLGLLGKCLPREVHAEITAEVRIRQEVRRDLVEKLVLILQSPAPQASEPQTVETASQSLPATVAMRLPALTHEPNVLAAQAIDGASALTDHGKHVRAGAVEQIRGAVFRSAAMEREAAERAALAGP